MPREESPEIRSQPGSLEATLNALPARDRNGARVDAMVVALAGRRLAAPITHGRWELRWLSDPSRKDAANGTPMLRHVVEGRLGGVLVFRDAIQQVGRPPFLHRGGDPRDPNRTVRYHREQRQRIDGTAIEVEVENAEENVLLATWIDLLHTIRSVTRNGTQPLIKQDPGTVSTFYADTADRHLRSGSVGQDTWAAARSMTGAVLAGTDSFYIAASLASLKYHCLQFFCGFDTSAIDDGDTIDATTFSLYGKNQFGSGQVAKLYTYEWGAEVDTGDAQDGTELQGLTELASYDAITNGWSTSAYNDFTETGTALRDAINKTGETKFVAADARQEDDVAPTADTSLGHWTADQTGTTQDPKLVVTHSAGGGGGDDYPYPRTVAVNPAILMQQTMILNL